MPANIGSHSSMAVPMLTSASDRLSCAAAYNAWLPVFLLKIKLAMETANKMIADPTDTYKAHESMEVCRGTKIAWTARIQISIAIKNHEKRSNQRGDGFRFAMSKWMILVCRLLGYL